MKSITFIVALAVSASTAAQFSPPPLPDGPRVGAYVVGATQAVTGGAPVTGQPHPGDCLLTAYCDAAHLAGTEIIPGGTIWFEAQNCVPAAFAPALPPFFLETYYQAGVCVTFFAFALHAPPAPVTLAGAAWGYDQVFLASIAVMTLQQYAHSPPWRPGEVHVVRLPVPLLSSLSGVQVDAQAIRVDPLDGLFYLSGVWSVRIA